MHNSQLKQHKSTEKLETKQPPQMQRLFALSTVNYKLSTD